MEASGHPLLNDDVRAMLRAFGRALTTAISESPQACASLERLRAEGYRLHVSVDFPTSDTTPEAAPPPPPTRAADPIFRINRHDLAFLRSCGIDPTRRKLRTE